MHVRDPPGLVLAAVPHSNRGDVAGRGIQRRCTWLSIDQLACDAGDHSHPDPRLAKATPTADLREGVVQ
jgi:hypothetical protein